MELSEWARKQGIHRWTARRCWRESQLAVRAIRIPSGTILLEAPPSDTGAAGRTVLQRPEKLVRISFRLRMARTLTDAPLVEEDRRHCC